MLNRVADLLEIRGENFFKIRAYREAVRQLDNLTTEVADLVKEGRLKDVPGIGEAIEKKIVEYVTTGQLEFLTRLEAEVPPALLELTRVPGLGPRTAKDIYDTLGILSLDALERSEEHTSELQSPDHLVCRLLLEKKKKQHNDTAHSNPTNGTSEPRLSWLIVLDSCVVSHKGAHVLTPRLAHPRPASRRMAYASLT